MIMDDETQTPGGDGGMGGDDNGGDGGTGGDMPSEGGDMGGETPAPDQHSTL